MSGASEFEALAADLGKASAKVARALYDTYKEAGDAFAADWAANAAQTSGTHGKWYPSSIDSETLLTLGVGVEVGPNSGKKQGRMGRGFELGSVNQPPHLDGLRAMPVAAERLSKMVDATIGFLLP